MQVCEHLISESGYKTFVIWIRTTARHLNFTRRVIERLQNFYQQMFIRWIGNAYWPDKIANEDIRRTTDQETVLERVQIRSRKSNWLWHMLRRGNERIAKQALQWTVHGQRERRPKNGKRSGERHGSNRLQVQLEENRDSSSMKKSDLWSMFSTERQGLS